MLSRFGLLNRLGLTTRMPTNGAVKERGRTRQISEQRQGERAVVAADARCWSGSPLDMRQTQNERIKALSEGIGDGAPTLLRVYRSRSFMKTCQAGRRRVPPW